MFRKIISTILLCIAVLSLILMSAENPDGSFNFWWSTSWIIVLIITTKLWFYINPNKEEK